VFEEAELDVGTHVDYEGDRLIEINLSQRDEYQGEVGGGGLTERSIYLSAGDATKFLEGLRTAIERCEKEVARRAAKEARREKASDEGKGERLSGTGGLID
jgi:hypothetical protein